MAVQFPQRTIQEQTAAYQAYAANTMFPYSFSFNALINGGHFPKSGGGFSYFTLGFQADNNLAISVLEFVADMNVVITGAGITAGFLFEVSYSPIAETTVIDNIAAAPAVPTTPSDTGNIIYRSIFTFVNTTATTAFVNRVDDYRRYEPYNYLLKYNQVIYMHIGINAATVAAGAGNINGIFIFHTLPTGLKI
jgi:hypothetical protein